MLHDAGMLAVYTLTDAKVPEDRRLEKLSECWYGERTIGVTRHFAAMQADCRVDMLLEVWEDRFITAKQYCIPQDGEQYRIAQVQHMENDSGLKISLLSLERLGTHYELASN